MNQESRGLKNWFPLMVVLCFVTVAAGLLSGCTRPNQPSGEATSTNTSEPTSLVNTSTPFPQLTETGTDKEAFDTRVAQRRAAVATEIALSPRPTPTQGPIYLRSPVPTATWATGYFGGLDRVNSVKPEYISCWAGYLDTKPMEVCAGHQQPLGGDPQQGMLQIRVWEQDQKTVVSIDAYETPQKVGVMHIVTANNDSVTIASEDNLHTFTFDIATRQWVNP